MKFAEQIKRKTPEEFEISIKNYFERVFGFRNVKTTKVKGDYGADLIGEIDNRKYAIQIKFYSAPVNLKAVQEAYAAKSHYKAEGCIVVTNSTFTESAINLADSTNCILVDGNDLDRIFSENFNSFDEQVEFLRQNKIRSFKISNEQLINAYFILKKQLRRQPTVEDIDKSGDFSSSSYKRRWGRWNMFLRHIGESCLVDRDITKDDLVTNFLDVFNKVGKVPTASDMIENGIYSISTYERNFGSWNEFLETQGFRPTKRHLISKQEFIAEYKQVKAKLRRVPTKAEFDRYANISSSSYRRIWGSWSKFLREQGVRTRDISDQELIAEYSKLKEYLGKQTLTQADMNKKGRFSSSTYERRFGSWNKFLQEIGETPNVRTGITKKDLLRDYSRIAIKLDKAELSASDIKRLSNYSLSTFLKIFGSWNSCKDEARKQSNT